MSPSDSTSRTVESTPAAVAIRRQRRERIWGRRGKRAEGVGSAYFVMRTTWLVLGMPVFVVDGFFHHPQTQAIVYAIYGPILIIGGLAYAAILLRRARRGATIASWAESRVEAWLHIAGFIGPILFMGVLLIGYAVKTWP